MSKTFGETKAVDAISFEIHRGEFFSLLGPSGCGKTTTLRLLAGFDAPDPDGGRILIDGRPVETLRPYERGVGMVFQSYALFPHLSVERNVGFGLKQRGTPSTELAERVRAALSLVRLDPNQFLHRMPAQLSGGQRQRVALARALVLEPPILLLDEPLGAIDLKLRKEMQLELRALNRSLGMTFVYVTHDQEEALTMSDRIVVMAESRIEQIGSPAEVYENPRTAFVASFIGVSNFIEGTVRDRTAAGWEAVTATGIPFRVPPASGLAPGKAVRIAVRPEWMDLFAVDAVPPDENALPGAVRDVVYLGETIHLVVVLDHGGSATVALRNEGQLNRPVPWRVGDRVAVGWLPEDGQVVEP